MTSCKFKKTMDKGFPIDAFSILASIDHAALENAMQIFKPLLSEVTKLRKHFERVETFRTAAKTSGRQLNGFGNDLVLLAKTHNIKQTTIAAILDVDPSVISRKYNS